MFKVLTHLVYRKPSLIQSNVIDIFTKYGSYQMKAYKEGDESYLTIMSKNFFDIEIPIVYIHSDSHECHPSNDQVRYCSNTIDMALKMVQKEGGVVIYYAKDGRSMDGLLQEIHARKLAPKKSIDKAKQTTFSVKLKKEHQALGFILKELHLSKIKLVTSHLKTIDIIEALGIEVVKKASAISFEYGEL
jgi:GTP cyclohydrolase II